MTDLSDVVPALDLQPYRHLIHSLEKNDITVLELLSLDPTDIVRKCPLPLTDLRALIQAIRSALQESLKQQLRSNNVDSPSTRPNSDGHDRPDKTSTVRQFIKTLDTDIDKCLGGGISTGHITEIVGESAAGKTQFVLGLLLSVQLPQPYGLARSAVYISTEGPLNTTRLSQMLASDTVHISRALDQRPTLDHVHTIMTSDLESQDHIIQYQLPVLVDRYNIGLVVLDSVAANFRAELETKTSKGLVNRAAELSRLGNTLRRIARDKNVAVVVTNQVSDRFTDIPATVDRIQPSSESAGDMYDDRTSLDHQQRFFTGWGDRPVKAFEQHKTPALGLAWANQLSTRIVLKMESSHSVSQARDSDGGNIWRDSKRRRLLSVVFSAWAAPTHSSIRYDITLRGVTSVQDAPSSLETESHEPVLEPYLWLDGADEEFP